MSTETKQQYEGAILEQLVKNAAQLAVVQHEITQLKNDVEELKTLKTDVADIQKTLNSARWLLVTILVGIIINIFSQPILSLLP